VTYQIKVLTHKAQTLMIIT